MNLKNAKFDVTPLTTDQFFTGQYCNRPISVALRVSCEYIYISLAINAKESIRSGKYEEQEKL